MPRGRKKSVESAVADSQAPIVKLFKDLLARVEKLESAGCCGAKEKAKVAPKKRGRKPGKKKAVAAKAVAKPGAKKRGRPPKVKVEEKTSEPVVVKRRGRPRKNPVEAVEATATV